MSKSDPINQAPSNLEWVDPKDLRANPRNARTHSQKQIEAIAQSLRRFRAINPVVIDGRNRILAGHARVDAARMIGLDRLPAVRVTHLTDAQARAYMLADNKLAERAGWDREILLVELQELHAELPEIGLDLDITGFEPGEIEAIFDELLEDRTTPADELPDAKDIRAVAKSGDLFILGKHRLLVGDARSEDAHSHLMQGDKAAMAFLDPPYNVKVQGHVCGRGQIKHREFTCASGEMTSNEFVEFLEQTLGLASQHVADGSISYVCMDWRHLQEVLTAGLAVYDELKNLCVWTKSNAGQGSFYRSQHELILVYKKGKAPHLNTFELGQHGRTRSNVWSYSGVNSFRAGRLDELKMHPTVKPVALIADAMRDCSRRGSIILDVFAGSGSTLIAAEQIGRRAYCMEIDPGYADVIITRWQKVTGKDAILESSAKIFNEISRSEISRAS